MNSPQAYRWIDDYHREQRGIIAYAGEPDPVRRMKHDVSDLSDPFGPKPQVLMKLSCTRELTWAFEERMTPLPFRED